MLVLSRRVGEELVIGPDVTVRVVETRCGRVRLAIDAPADVTVRRGELIADGNRSRQHVDGILQYHIPEVLQT